MQLRGAIEAVFQSWGGARAIAYRERERIPHDLGTAVNVQTMVFGNRDDNSGTGVGFTRDASTGENKPYGDFLVNAQGEDVVAGIRNTEDLDALAKQFPKIHKELLDIFARLEKHYRDMCDTEFTIEQGKLWMLQTRVGKRTGAAALRMAVEMTKQKGWKISQSEALLRVAADHLDQVLHPQFEGGDKKVIAKGLAASPGAAVGRVYFTADDAVDASERGEKVILVRNETSPEDVHGMQVAEGILTARGGLVSHAAVVARGWGIPAVVGADAVKIAGNQFTAGGGRPCTRATPSRSTAPPARSCSAPWRWPTPSRPRSSTSSSGGPTASGRASSPCAPTPTPATTPRSPATSAPRASASAAPSTCSSARTASRSCGR